MADQEIKEVEDETRARGGKRTSDNKIAEFSTSKSKKRAKKALANLQGRAEAQKYWKTPLNLLMRPLSSHASRESPEMWPTEIFCWKSWNLLSTRPLPSGTLGYRFKGLFITFRSSRGPPNSLWKGFTVPPRPLLPGESARPSS